MDWKSTDTAPDGVAVMTRIDDGNGVRNEQVMVKNGNLWFVGELYVYYRPTHWRELSQIEKLRIKTRTRKRQSTN